MKAHLINSFRIPSESQLSALSFKEFKISGKYSQGYNPAKEIELKHITSISDNKTYSPLVFFADTENWDPMDSDVQIHQEFKINSEAFLSLFEGENIIAGSEDVLGISVHCRFSPSSIMKWEEVSTSEDTKKISITKNELKKNRNKDIIFCLDSRFNKGEYCDSLILDYYLFLKEKKTDKQNGIVNNCGTLLGKIGSQVTVKFNGEGSSFPLAFIDDSDNNHLLWKIVLPSEIDELYLLPFSEDYICIHINKKHPSFIKLNLNEDEFSQTELFKEIFSSALVQMLYELYLMFKSDDNAGYYSLKDSIDNSIANVFNYYMYIIFGKENYLEESSEEEISLQDFHEKVRVFIETQNTKEDKM